MRIGYFITHYPYEKHYDNYFCGGMEVAASSLAVNMANKGHEISIFTTSFDSNDSVEKHENMKIYRYGANFRIGQANMSFALLRKPLAYDIDIVHAHAGNPPAPIAALRYARNKKKPLVVTYHMDAQTSWGGIIRRTSVFFYNKFLLNYVLSNSKSIISPSKNFLDSSIFLANHKNKVSVIPNGIDTDTFIVPYSKAECRKKLGFLDKEYIILFIGSLSPHKSPDVLLRTMPALKQKMPNIRLIIVGEGVLKNQLKITSKELCVENEVNFVDYVDNQQRKAMLYKSSDVFVLPSTQESFGIVILEAMASGIPVIATAIGGITNLIQDGQTGLLVPVQNPEILAVTIEKLLRNCELRQKLSKEGRLKANEYAWPKIADQTEVLYRKVIE